MGSQADLGRLRPFYSRHLRDPGPSSQSPPSRFILILTSILTHTAPVHSFYRYLHLGHSFCLFKIPNSRRPACPKPHIINQSHRPPRDGRYKPVRSDSDEASLRASFRTSPIPPSWPFSSAAPTNSISITICIQPISVFQLYAFVLALGSWQQRCL